MQWSHVIRPRGVVPAAVAAWLAASPSGAQPPASGDTRASAVQPPASAATSAVAPVVTITVGGGYSSLAARDIAITGRPVDASPTALVGRGAAISLRLDRARPAALHRVEADLSAIRGFSYRSPLATAARAGGEGYTRFGARYEYRRYPLRDVLFAGLDAGVGVEGSGDRRSLTRRMPGAIENNEVELRAGIGLVVAARLRRWQRFDLEAGWVNAAVFGRTTQRHSEAGSPFSSLGGGWATDLRATARVRVASRMRLSLSYAGDGAGFLSSHHAVASNSRQLIVGVAYDK